MPITIDAQSSLERATRQLNSHNIGCLLVTDAATGWWASSPSAMC
ncbi:MAG: hypothetical protein R2911_05105 [Caldilineaceae bacterium]